MLLQYLGKLKIQILQIFSRYERRCKHIAFASNFVVRPQILIFSVLKNMSFLILIANNFLCHCSLVISFCHQCVASEIRRSRCYCSVCQRSTWYSATKTRFWWEVVFEGIHSKEVDRRISCETLDKRGVNKLLNWRNLKTANINVKTAVYTNVNGDM